MMIVYFCHFENVRRRRGQVQYSLWWYGPPCLPAENSRIHLSCYSPILHSLRSLIRLLARLLPFWLPPSRCAGEMILRMVLQMASWWFFSALKHRHPLLIPVFFPFAFQEPRYFLHCWCIYFFLEVCSKPPKCRWVLLFHQHQLSSISKSLPVLLDIPHRPPSDDSSCFLPNWDSSRSSLDPPSHSYSS